jgi:iron(III) transport system permease protein
MSSEVEVPPAPSRHRRRPTSILGGALSTIVLVVVALVVLCPVVLLVVASLRGSEAEGTAALGFGAWSTAWQQPGMLPAIANTLRRVLVTEAISLPIAVLIAWLVARTDLPGKALIDNILWIAVFLPALPVLMGWILLFDPDNGIVNRIATAAFGRAEPLFDIYSFGGIVFAHLASRSIAAKYIFLVPAFRNLDATSVEASTVAGAGAMTTLRRIVVPMLLPAILITLVISLTYSLESFEIELILGRPVGFFVFSTKIYQLIRNDPPLFGPATVLGLVLLIVILPLILWQQRLIAGRNAVTLTAHFKPTVLRLRRLRWPLFVPIALLGGVVTVLPASFLVLGTFMNLFGNFDLDSVWTLQHWREVLGDATLLRALTNTLVIAGSAAGIGCVWFTLIAYISVRTRYAGRAALDFLTWVPAMLPGIVMGLGMLWMFLTLPFFRPIYGTMLVLVVAVMLNVVTTGVQLAKSNLVQIGRELEEASFLVGASWLYTFRRIVLPILGPVLIAIALLTFTTASRNVANIAMLVTSRTRPLAMLQVDYMVDGSYEAAAIVGVIIVLLSLGAAVLARAIGRAAAFRTV